MSARRRTIDCLGLGIMPLDLLFTVDQFPAAGEKIDGRRLVIQGGGPVPNVLVGLARLGFRGALITAVGDDIIGGMGIEAMRREGVDVRFMARKRGSSDTASGFIEAGSGRRTLVLNRTIHVRPSDVVIDRFPRARLVHLDGRDMPATMRLARWAKRTGATVSFDIGSMRNDVSAVFPLVDHLVVADSYALPFTGAKTASQAISRLARYCGGSIVVTEGTRGARGVEDGRTAFHPAYRVDAVDTTGAGDAFHVGYLYGLLTGAPLTERLKLGAAVAAIKCCHAGARHGLPTLAQLGRFLKKPLSTYA